MIANELLMQFQADILNKPVVRPAIKETTALGATYAAGLGVGFFRNADDLCANWSVNKTWTPNMDGEKRESMYQLWKKAVSRTFDWVEEPTVSFEVDNVQRTTSHLPPSC